MFSVHTPQCKGCFVVVFLGCRQANVLLLLHVFVFGDSKVIGDFACIFMEKKVEKLIFSRYLSKALLVRRLAFLSCYLFLEKFGLVWITKGARLTALEAGFTYSLAKVMQPGQQVHKPPCCAVPMCLHSAVEKKNQTFFKDPRISVLFAPCLSLQHFLLRAQRNGLVMIRFVH